MDDLLRVHLRVLEACEAVDMSVPSGTQYPHAIPAQVLHHRAEMFVAFLGGHRTALDKVARPLIWNPP